MHHATLKLLTAAFILFFFWHLAPAQITGFDFLWGKYEEKDNPRTTFLFSPTNIVATINGTQEVWKVVSGKNLVEGMTLARGDQQVKVKANVHLHDMKFHLGKRTWVLVQSKPENSTPSPTPSQK